MLLESIFDLYFSSVIVNFKAFVIHTKRKFRETSGYIWCYDGDNASDQINISPTFIPISDQICISPLKMQEITSGRGRRKRKIVNLMIRLFSWKVIVKAERWQFSYGRCILEIRMIQLSRYGDTKGFPVDQKKYIAAL